jgi:hypothetical protein
MNQIYWMLELIPESVLLWLYYTALTAGIIMLAASWLVKWFPGISNYKSLIQLAGVVLTAGSLYLLGGYGVEIAWRDKVKDLEAKVKLAEEQSTTKNVEIQEKIVTKTKIITEKGKTQIEYVDRVITQDKEVIKYIEQCPVPKAIIDAHNAAAEMNKAAEGKK